MTFFYIDENVSPSARSSLEHLYRQHTFTTPQRANLLGWYDDELFAELALRGVDAIITIDAAQLDDPHERACLYDSGLHWIGLPPVPGRGLHLVAQQLSMVALAIARLVEDWPAEPTAFRLQAPGEVVLSAEPLSAA